MAKDTAQDAPSEEMSPSSEGYGESQIQVLHGLEAVRKRPGMYIGDTTIRGLHHLVWEIVDNSVDEAMAGRCQNISVTINVDGSCTIVDDGVGIPVGPHPTEKVSTLEVVFCQLHAGGKFDHDAYKVSGGLHGVGASVVNALSEWLEVEVAREGDLWRMSFERGDKREDLKKIGTRKRSGTKVTFMPDGEIFPDKVFRYETLVTRVRELAYLNEGVCFKLKDERSGKEEAFKFNKGLVAFVQHLNEGKVTLHPPVVLHKEDPATKLTIDLVLQYTDKYNETLFTFANNINTIEGGTHLSGFKSALTRTVNAYAKGANLLKNDVAPSGEDVREGLTAVVSVKVPDPQFEGQTKTKLGNSDVEGFVTQAVNEELGGWMEQHPTEARRIVAKGIQAMQAREAARKARDLTRKKGSMFGDSLVGKLAKCRSNDMESIELFLVEGDSAAGPAKQGRDSLTQAILPLRGKILNVEKARLDRILNSEEIQKIIQALGCGIGEEDFDAARIKYGKVIIMTDADVDGSHIRTLLLTFFFRHMKKLLEDGRIYIAQPPLYLIQRKKHSQYVLEEKEMRKTYADLGMDQTRLEVRDISGRKPKVVATFEKGKLKELLDILDDLADKAEIVHRRGIAFAELLAHRNKEGRLPTHWMILNGRNLFFHSRAEYNEFLARRADKLVDDGEEAAPAAKAPGGKAGKNGKSVPPDPAAIEEARHRVQKRAELHEVAEIERSIGKLATRGLSMNDYFGVREETVTGDKPPAKYLLVTEDEPLEVDNVGSIAAGIRKIGARGMEVKRFKGLGEMNADQLWETTMDPQRRVLLRIKAEEAEEAERMFTLLMGDDVELRRDFIEQNALAVKNLDV